MEFPRTFAAPYLHRAITDLQAVSRDVVHLMANIDFDSFVVTGVSGLWVADRISRALGKPFVFVRKENDSSHATGRLEGTIGKRWVFLDDFMCSGATLDRVCDTIEKACGNETELVGVCEYMDNGARPRYCTREELVRGLPGRSLEALYVSRLQFGFRPRPDQIVPTDDDCPF